MTDHIAEAAEIFSLSLAEAGQAVTPGEVGEFIRTCLRGLTESETERVRCGPVEASYEDRGHVQLVCMIDSVVIPYPTGIELSR